MCDFYINSEYERLHIFFWLLKDFGWVILSKPVWYMGLIPTLTMSIDFAWIVANVNVCQLRCCKCAIPSYSAFCRG